MIWSQLRKQIRSRIYPALQARVDFHRAVYPKSWEGIYDRAWITLDGQEVLALSHGEWSKARREAERAVVSDQPEADWPARSALVASKLAEEAVECTSFLGTALHRYLELPIAEAWASANPVIRALAMIDRRTGRRTLAKVTLAADDHALVRAFYELRMGT